MSDAKSDDKDKELPPNTKRFKDDAAKLKDFLVSFGGMAGVFYAAFEAFTSAEPYKPILALSLALLVFGGLSIWLGESGYPRYGKLITLTLMGIGLVGCVFGGLLFWFPPNIINVFQLDEVKMKHPSRHVTIVATKEYYPMFAPLQGKETEPSLFLEIAKGKYADELVIRRLTLILKEYKTYDKGDHKEPEPIYQRFKDVTGFTAILHPKYEITEVRRSGLFNEATTKSDTMPIHVFVDAVEPGLYTFVCRIEVSCYGRTEYSETAPIKMLKI